MREANPTVFDGALRSLHRTNRQKPCEDRRINGRCKAGRRGALCTTTKPISRIRIKPQAIGRHLIGTRDAVIRESKGKRMRKDSAQFMVLNHLRVHGPMSCKDVERIASVSNPADVIYRLRESGHNVRAHRHPKTGRSIYFLMEPKRSFLRRFIDWLKG